MKYTVLATLLALTATNFPADTVAASTLHADLFPIGDDGVALSAPVKSSDFDPAGLSVSLADLDVGTYVLAISRLDGAGVPLAPAITGPVIIKEVVVPPTAVSIDMPTAFTYTVTPQA